MFEALGVLGHAQGPAERRQLFLVVEEEDGLKVVAAHVAGHAVPVVVAW